MCGQLFRFCMKSEIHMQINIDTYLSNNEKCSQLKFSLRIHLKGKILFFFCIGLGCLWCLSSGADYGGKRKVYFLSHACNIKKEEQGNKIWYFTNLVYFLFVKNIYQINGSRMQTIKRGSKRLTYKTKAPPPSLFFPPLPFHLPLPFLSTYRRLGVF